VKAELILTVTLALLAMQGCSSSTCDDRCDDLAAQCGEASSECEGDCDTTETACETCFGCLQDNDACEIQPGGPCVGPCAGCREN
jgi:hypothetical protein